jgi:hypothetical protein
MLRPREPLPAPALPGERRDPLISITVMVLTLLGVGLFIAGVLAVYTYSTPGAEVPLVIAISLAFAAILALNLIGRAVQHWRTFQ